MKKIKLPLFIIGLASLVSCTGKKNIDKISLFNKSSEDISSIKLTVCSKVIDVSDLKVNSKADVSYDVIGDCHYNFLISFSSGKNMDKQVGYVTNGFSYEHEITITDTEVVMADPKVK